MPVQSEEILRLQALDLRIDALARERAALDTGAALKRELDAVVAALSVAQERLHRLQTDQTSAELELQTIEGKKAAMTKKLYEGRVTNPKELQAMDQEIEMFGRQRGRLDERILTLMDEIETTSLEVAELSGKREDLESRWRGQVDSCKKDVARITAELGQLGSERTGVAGQVEASSLRRYEDLRRKSANLAAVRIQDGICDGCRTGVPAVLQRRAQDAVSYAFCENCGRFLFPPEE